MKKILIVEDNQIWAENLALILRGKFEILRANSAAQAIEQIDKHAPNLIFLDILLNGHSAFSLLNELQSYADTCEIPVVIFSNLAEEMDLSALKNYGVRAIIDKSKTSPSEILKVAEDFCAAN